MFGSGVMPFARKQKPTMEEMIAAIRLLAARGPLFAEVIVKELGCTPERWWDVVSACRDWFTLTAKGWALTEAGRDAVSGPD